jgi:hypothetical protein
VQLPLTLREIGDCFLYRSPSVQRVDLSRTALGSVGDSFCRGCEKLREVRLPPTLKEIGACFLYRSPSVEYLDLSGGGCGVCRWFVLR